MSLSPVSFRRRTRLIAPVVLVLGLLLTVLVASAVAPPNVDTFADNSGCIVVGWQRIFRPGDCH